MDGTNRSVAAALRHGDDSGIERSKSEGRRREVGRGRVATWFLAGTSFVAALIGTARGMGQWPDSTYYISAGRNLANGRGLVIFTGESLTLFPPGLPSIVAAGDSVGMSADCTLRLVNALALAGVVVLAAVLLERHVRSRRLVVGGTLMVAVTTTLLADATMAGTETVFIAVSLLFILALEHLLTTRVVTVGWRCAWFWRGSASFCGMPPSRWSPSVSAQSSSECGTPLA